MSFYRLIFSSLWHYRRQTLTIALGMGIGMAVITGALVTGDSVRGGLSNLVGIRLGNVDLSVSAGDRYLTDSLSIRIRADLGVPVAPVLQLEGSATAGGGSIRLPKVQVFGIDDSFREVLGPATFEAPTESNEAVVSDNLAERLNIHEGDEVLLRISKPGPVPLDAPFVSDEENIVSIRVTVRSIAGKEPHGRFHLRNIQSAPFNVFIRKSQLQKMAGLEGLSNLILIAGNGKVSESLAKQSLAVNRTLRDAGLDLEKDSLSGTWILRTPRVFFDPATLAAIESVPAEKTRWFTYFVNEISTGGQSTPYSFVSTLPGSRILPGEILVNRWIADDLDTHIGDSVTMSYFMVGPLRNLTVENSKFRVAGILSMDDPLCDKSLMPEIPGLSDAGNCRDWETSIPIDLEKIRDKDEAYWNQYRGTPKAFINSTVAASLWQNRFGKYTQVQFEANTKKETIDQGILSHLLPADMGVVVSQPAREGLAAADGGTDFSSLFLGLSFFLIAGGIILTILLIRLGLEGRTAQTGTLRALGWPERKIRRMLLLENVFVGIPGTLLGLLLTYVYATLIFRALNGVWNDIVLTDTLRPIFKPETLVLGMVINILVSLGSAWLALRRFFKRRTIELLRFNESTNRRPVRRILSIMAFATVFLSILILVFGLIRIDSVKPTFFFIAGTLMLLGSILLAIRLIRYHTPVPEKKFSSKTLINSNIRLSSNRSLSVIILFSIGIFMVIAVGANRKTTNSAGSKRTPENQSIGSLPSPSGTGGFMFFMETTVPVPDNLNNPLVRAKYGLETPSGFVQMKKLEGDDASCLNLNRVTNPPLLSVPRGALNGRFLFASKVNSEIRDQPWQMLEQDLPDGIIPAVADQTVIQWGLGLKIGDTLHYKAENGDTVKILLAGGLANSIFQGNLLISEKAFIEHWPSVSGTHVFLVSANPGNFKPVQDELLNIFRDYGAELSPTDVKLAEFSAIENTYLSIFLFLGALAMLLGTIGLAIILARNLQERRSEIALLRATGFSKLRILWLVVREYSVLLIYGTLSGGLAALISVLPGLLSPAGEVSTVFLLSILVILVANGLIWIVALGWNSVRKPGIVASLRTE